MVRNDNENVAIHFNPFNQNFSIGTGTIQVSLNSPSIAGWVGQNIKVPIEAMDELGNPAGALLRFNLNASIHVCDILFIVHRHSSP